MKSAKHSIKTPTSDFRISPPRRVALKVQRRRYGYDALTEIGVHHFLRQEKGPSQNLIGFHEAFFHDGHVCSAFELHGRSLDAFTEKGPLPLNEVRIIARQLLGALARMHERGFAHTDVKPLNILYRRSPRPRAKLSDLGNADNVLRQGSNRCTRNYTPPEVLLGNPLDLRIDIWSLACTIFELATGHDLFDPYQAAGRKYAEFNQELPDEAFDPGVEVDSAEEINEQYRPGTILGGKYQLESCLGQGNFATVWRAVTLHDEPLDGTYDNLLAGCKALEVTAAVSPEKKPTPQPEDTAHAWRKARGARDLHDLVLNYEHLGLMQQLLGPPPPAWVTGGLYANAYCNAAGQLKHDLLPPKAIPLESRLRRCKMKAEEARHLTAFLQPMLSWEPSQRPTAPVCLEAPWLTVTPTGKRPPARPASQSDRLSVSRMTGSIPAPLLSNELGPSPIRRLI
jgi:serine/threonine protein kinase